jgi:hypothetical protein
MESRQTLEPLQPAMRLAAAKACGIAVAIPAIATLLGARAAGAAPRGVAHLDAILSVGGFGVLALAGLSRGIWPPSCDRPGMVSDSLTGPFGVRATRTNQSAALERRAIRRAWRTKP